MRVKKDPRWLTNDKLTEADKVRLTPPLEAAEKAEAA